MRESEELTPTGLGESLIPEKKIKLNAPLPPTLQIVRPDGVVSNKNSPSLGRKELDKNTLNLPGQARLDSESNLKLRSNRNSLYQSGGNVEEFKSNNLLPRSRQASSKRTDSNKHAGSMNSIAQFIGVGKKKSSSPLKIIESSPLLKKQSTQKTASVNESMRL